MNNEQKVLIDEAYEHYYNYMRDDRQWELNKEEFIEEIKTDKDFSEKWGLTIEERELSLEERVDIFNTKMKNQGLRTQIAIVGVDENYWKSSLEKTEHNIPTRLITVTYQNKTITSYE